jgi:hypothetical protein
MNTVVWTTLITAVATVTGSLGTVCIKVISDDRAEVSKAKDARAAEASGRRREAYAQLLTTVRKALEQARLLQVKIESKAEIDNRFILSPDELAQVVALAELLGSPESRQHIQVIYEKIIDLYEFYLQPGATAASSDSGSHGGTRSELEQEIKSFIGSVRLELED